jgi:hypothetical protein
MTAPRKNAEGQKGQGSQTVKLPEPWQLAKIAAACDPQFYGQGGLDGAVQRAVQLYLRAKDFVEKYNGKPLADLAAACGDQEFALKLSTEEMQAPFAETLRFEPDRATDEVRSFFAKYGVRLKTDKAVLDNLHQYFRVQHVEMFLMNHSPEWQRARDAFENAKAVSVDGKIKLRLPPATQRALLAGKKRPLTRREQDQQNEKQAKRLGWTPAQSEAEWNHWLAEARTTENGKPVYALRKNMLGSLVNWKKSRKISGGKRSLETAAAQKPAAAAKAAPTVPESNVQAAGTQKSAPRA